MVMDVTALRLSPSEGATPQGCDDTLWQYDRAVGLSTHEVIEWVNAVIAKDDSARPAIVEIANFYRQLAARTDLDLNHATDCNA